MVSLLNSPVTYRSREPQPPRIRVALLEDVPAEAAALVGLLGGNGHDVVQQSSGEKFLELLRRDSFDVLILDWGIADISGYEVLRRVRHELHSNVPVLMLTARNGEFEVVQALNGGADDYLVKPWRPFELLARVKVLVRSSQPPAGLHQDESIEGWLFRSTQKIVVHAGSTTRLSHKEFEVARLLFRHLGRPLSREHLKQAVWSDDANSRTIDTHVSRVRTRLGLTIEHGFQLQAVYGFGYRLDRVDGVR